MWPGAGWFPVKITFFGLSISSSWGNGHAAHFRAILRALHRLGHRVAFYERDLGQLARHREFTASDDFDLRLYRSWDEIRHTALEEADASDVVLVASHVPEGARIADAVLALDRPLRAYYEMNAPHTLARLRDGSLDYVRALQLPDFDLVLSRMGGRSLSALELDYGARLALPLYACVDPELHLRMPARPALRCELSFPGSCTPQRLARLKTLLGTVARRRPSWRFLVAGAQSSGEVPAAPRKEPRRAESGRGSSSPKTLPPLAAASARVHERARRGWPAHLQRLELLSEADRVALFSSSRLVLDLPRRAAQAWGYCPSGRLFAAAACGTPVVTTGFEGLERFLEPEAEVLVAGNAAALLEAMERSDAELLGLGRRARERTLDEHTGYQRALTMLAAFEAARAPRLLRLARGAMEVASVLPHHRGQRRVG